MLFSFFPKKVSHWFPFFLDIELCAASLNTGNISNKFSFITPASGNGVIVLVLSVCVCVSSSHSLD